MNAEAQTLTFDGRPWVVPSRGPVGMACLIVAECAIFVIFIVAYLYYLGKSLSGPLPEQVLQPPVFISLCLLSSSATITLAERALARGGRRGFAFWWSATIALALVFLAGTGREWYELMNEHGLTIRTNLFGTTFYSLVGLHACHVIVGLLGLGLVLLFALGGRVHTTHRDRIKVLGMYWHFVDAVWVVVFTVVYVIGR
jgi:cytochrome c oxidase subunit 3